MSKIVGVDWRRVSLRWLALCGVIVPPADAIVNAIVASHQPGYNYFRDYASDLAARGRPDSLVLCYCWAVFPLTFGPFAFAVYTALRPKPGARAVGFLLALFSICMGLCGVFRFDPTSPEHTFSSRAHVVVSALASAALFVCPFLLWLATRHDPEWRFFRGFSLVIQVGGVVGAALLIIAFLNIGDLGGFAERTYWGVNYVWIVGLALKLRQLGASA